MTTTSFSVNRVRAARKRARALAAAHNFGRDESGVMIAFSIFFFLIILLVAGIGVDLMRFEMERTKLQNTLDRAVLAAADMQQTLDPTSVVMDYFAKANLNATLDTPSVNSGLNFREVSALAHMNVPTQFMHMMGVDTLVAPALATAEEAIEGIEVVLVLDVSGSMGSNNRLVNLKPAASEFVDTVLALAPAGKVSVSIVPYNTQVATGAALLSHYNRSDAHNFSYCVNFEAADFSTTALSTGQPLEQTAHFDINTDSGGSSLPPSPTDLARPVCSILPASQIKVMSNNATALKNQINAFVSGGNTSIDVGMKWASALVDPGTRAVIDAMIADGDVDPHNAGRPVSFSEPGVLKVIVVMTDGQNTSQWMLRDDLRTGLSDVWFNDSQNRYSIRMTGGPNQFYWVGANVWQDHAFGNGSGETGPAVRLTNQQLFALNSTRRVATEIYDPAYANLGLGSAEDDWHNLAREFVPDVVKDTRLQSICSAAKGNDVVIYSIGFEATANGEIQMRNCASSPSHFFDVNGVEISSAFQAIAASIAQLRLTQ